MSDKQKLYNHLSIIMTNNVIIENFAGLIDAFDVHHPTLYRGVASCHRHRLIPSIGRNLEFTYNKHIEERMFRLFKEESSPFLKGRHPDDWKFLALAQHYGLPTRLLDRTWNPLVALFFAVHYCDEEDGAVYGLCVAIVPPNSLSISPFETPGCCIYKPTHFDNRIIAQSGTFTSQDKPDQEFDTHECDVIIIPRHLKKDIRHKLRVFNIHTGSLFPSLEGVAKTIREDSIYN